MKNYKLQLRANLYDYRISPLINEEGEGEDPNDFKLPKELVNDLWDWVVELRQEYHIQSSTIKLGYEIRGLQLVNRLLQQLPRWVQLSYYSEFYKKEVFFY